MNRLESLFYYFFVNTIVEESVPRGEVVSRSIVSVLPSADNDHASFVVTVISPI